MAKIKYCKIVGLLLFFILIFSSIISNCFIYQDKANINLTYTKSIINNNTNYNSFNKNEGEIINNKISNFDKFLAEDEVYLGGIPIGINVKSEGVLVVDFNKLDNNLKNKINVGDVIVQIDNVKIDSVNALQHYLATTKKNNVELKIKQNNEYFIVDCKLFMDKNSNKKQLGIKVKDNILGLGTLTYVNRNGRFGALGHHIYDSDTGASSILNNGYICNSLIVNTTKSKYNVAGHLNGLLIDKNIVGTIDKNINFGLFGSSNINLISNLPKIKVNNRDNIKVGKAQIFTTVKGAIPKLYDIEIIKLNKQKFPAEKGMVIRVTDKELIAESGGVVQGMSGSPIIQNGKLIGAVTHVFLNDSKKGYGIYIDCMLPN